MRTIAMFFAILACMVFVGAPLAIADDTSDELAEVRMLIEQLQGQVEAQSEQIEHQGEVIRRARLERTEESDSPFGFSGMAAFFERIEVESHFAGSYFWNFNDPGAMTSVGGPAGTTGGNTGISGNIYPFHGNHNSFQVDQVWFGLEYPVDKKNRAGFRFDLVYGTTACTLGNAVPSRCGFGGIGGSSHLSSTSIFNDNTSQYYVNQAYVQYLAPITDNGILIKAGKWATPVGAEAPEATANFNITRGILFSMLQPEDHVGVLASSDVGERGGFSAAFGVMNDDENGLFGAGSDPDRNDSKSILFQIAWAGETTSVANTILWGPSELYSDDHASGLWDVVLTWEPNESVLTWFNFDYGWHKAEGPNQHAWGLATAGRYAVTERLGISGRVEFVKDDNGYAGWLNSSGSPSAFFGYAGTSPRSSAIYSLTGTLDYALTRHLMLRGELRYDDISKDNSNDDEFFDKGGDFKPDQTTAGVEIVYEF